MNETLEPYVKKLLDGGMKTAEDIAKFVEVQTPELGKEIINWGAVSEMMAPLFGVFILIFCICFHFAYRKRPWYIEKLNNCEPPVVLFNAIAFIVGALIFLLNIMDVIYPLVAPRLYILEKVSSLVK